MTNVVKVVAWRPVSPEVLLDRGHVMTTHRLVPVSRDIHVDDCPEAHWRCCWCGEVWPGYPEVEQECGEAS